MKYTNIIVQLIPSNIIFLIAARNSLPADVVDAVTLRDFGRKQSMKLTPVVFVLCYQVLYHDPLSSYARLHNKGVRKWLLLPISW